MEGYTQVHLHEICSYCYALRSTFFFLIGFSLLLVSLRVHSLCHPHHHPLSIFISDQENTRGWKHFPPELGEQNNTENKQPLEDLISSWCVILLSCFSVDWQKKWRDGLAHISPICCKVDVRIPWPERRHFYFFFLFKNSVKQKINNHKIITFSVAILKYLFGR